MTGRHRLALVAISLAALGAVVFWTIVFRLVFAALAALLRCR